MLWVAQACCGVYPQIWSGFPSVALKERRARLGSLWRQAHAGLSSRSFVPPSSTPLPKCSEAVQRAMLLCARDAFVPREHAREALVDSPIRVEAAGYNISAPHMHATALDELDIQPGLR